MPKAISILKLVFRWKYHYHVAGAAHVNVKPVEVTCYRKILRSECLKFPSVERPLNGS